MQPPSPPSISKWSSLPPVVVTTVPLSCAPPPFVSKLAPPPGGRGPARPVVRRAAPETAGAAGSHIVVVIHRDRQSFAAVFPRRSAVIAYIASAIVGIVNPAWRPRRHEQ